MIPQRSPGTETHCIYQVLASLLYIIVICVNRDYSLTIKRVMDRLLGKGLPLCLMYVLTVYDIFVYQVISHFIFEEGSVLVLKVTIQKKTV